MIMMEVVLTVGYLLMLSERSHLLSWSVGAGAPAWPAQTGVLPAEPARAGGQQQALPHHGEVGPAPCPAPLAQCSRAGGLLRARSGGSAARLSSVSRVIRKLYR